MKNKITPENEKRQISGIKLQIIQDKWTAGFFILEGEKIGDGFSFEQWNIWISAFYLL